MLPFYPFYWADYSSKTFDLTIEEHGAYMLFLRHIYTTGNPIPDKQCFSIARAMTEQQQRFARNVLEKFFVFDGENWRNLRCEEVINEQNIKHQKRVDAGRSGGNAKSKAKLKQSSSNATAILKQCPSNQNQNQNQISISSHSSEIDKPAKPKKFQKPTIAEIQSFCQQRKNSVDAEKFFNYYESKGWIVGKAPMKNWQSSVINWEKNSFANSNSNTSQNSTKPSGYPKPQYDNPDYYANTGSFYD